LAPKALANFQKNMPGRTCIQYCYICTLRCIVLVTLLLYRIVQ